MKRKSQANNSDPTDEIVVDDDEQFEWLTNQVESEAGNNNNKRTKTKYDAADVCVIGMERIVTDVNDDSFDDLPATAVEAKITLARMYYERFHEHMVQNTHQTTANAIMEKTRRMDSLDRMYNTLLGALDERLKQLKLMENTGSMVNSTIAPETSRDVRVKKLEIEQFSGEDVRKWPQFKSMFEECFHKRNEYSNTVKFYHLMSHLVTDSEAYKTVAGLERTDANYESAWKLLCDAYDNERKIVNDIVLSFVDMDPVTQPTRASLIALVNTTNNLMQSLPKYKVNVDHWGPILVPLLVRKLDSESASEWAKKRDQKEIAKLEPLLTFIRNRADSLDAESTSSCSVPSQSYSNNSTNGSVGIVSRNGHFRGPQSNNYIPHQSTDSAGGYKHDPRSITNRRTKCYHCGARHQIFDCANFKVKSLIDKEKRLDELIVCCKCLRRGHNKDTCRLRNCSCGGMHNEKLLCPKAIVSNAITAVQTNESDTDVNAALIATLKVFACDSNGNSVKVRAMSDGGSHMTMISTRLVQQLKLKPKKLMIPLQGAGQFNLQSKAYVDLKIMPAENGSSSGEWVRAGVLNTISNPLPLEKFECSDWEHIQGLPLADTTFNVPGDVDLLLSVEFMARIEREGFKRDDTNSNRPVARNTTFGWIIYGGLPDAFKKMNMIVSHLSVSENQKIADNLERLWKVDDVTERTLMTEEEKLCKKIFDETVTRSKDGRYIVTMPIKNDPPKLGNSLGAAMARQFANERRFRKNPELKQKYVNDIQQFIDLDHMELVPVNEIDKDESEVYYVPHHAANSSKFRVVFDGSVKTSTGISLNDILMNGPRLQEDLVVIVMRFRTFRVALTTDITKMYRQVMVPESQRDLLRIVWRENENEPLKHYRMKRQTYGLKSSAYCCVAALCQCARDYAEEFPIASKAVLRSFYVDDGTLGADNDDDAEELYRQLNLMLGKGGFPLAKWATNSTRIQSVIGATAKTVDLDLFNESSVLGIKWSVTDDRFKYGLSSQIPNQPPTKRFIVASVARLFDPNGWIAPIVVLGKVLIQDIWRTQCDWDTIVPDHIQKRWHEFRNALTHLSNITIPRWLGIEPGKLIQIHGFADASAKSYGMCFYVRAEGHDSIECNLVIAKTKVAPLKGMTIPRLELSAVVMMANALKQVCDTHGVCIENVTLWTDSSIVIHWLSKNPVGMKEFVARRVADVQDLTKGVQWKHVKTNDNPADLASRGVLVNELVENSLWFNGPSWLRQTQDKWPVSQFTVDQLVEKAAAVESIPRKTMTVIRKEIVPRIDSPQSQSRDELLIDHCSSMMKLVRVTARILRFTEAMKRLIKRDGKQYSSMAIRTDEYLNAQAIWIKYHQEKWFPNELAFLCAANQNKKSNGVARESPLLKLTPFIDGDGIMRVGGRIKRSLMPFDTKHPIILHGDGQLAHLLALEAHARTLHGGTQQCVQYIRQRFWILKLRKAVKRVSRKCIPCFRQRREVAEQLMGDLPHARVVAGHAFESVGVDYFGPIEVKERVGRCKKVYKAHVALFVCMKSRGVYLDLVTDLTTDAFLACLSRLTSARGRPNEIFSDNATTFHGASNEMRAIHAHWSELANSPKVEPIKWTFITPLSPSQGGLWERAVRSAKHHLRRVIGTQILTYEEYDTLLKNVASCLNSRPLIALDDDPSSAQALTPAHLFMGRAIIGPLQYDYVDIPDNRLQRWRLIQKLSQQFWAQWQQEVVANQIERSKWRIERDNVAVGAVVLVKFDNMPPTHWPLGRVVAVFPGDDGRVRNVEVKMGNSTYKRSVTKIAVLPIDDEEE